MEAGAFAVFDPAQPQRELSKIGAHGRVGKTIAAAVDQKERGLRKALGSLGVIHFKRCDGRGVQRNQTQSASLTFLHGQDALREIDLVPA